MAQSQQLIETLKRCLKGNNLTYADVARGLSLSEASVKRLFAEGSFSLARLDKVCALMGMELSDLLQAMVEHQQRPRISALSEEQEREIANDIELLLVTVCVLNRWTWEQITQQFVISPSQCTRHLARLDRLQLIDLLANNQFRLKVETNFKWRRNGPIQKFFQAHADEDFLNCKFDQKHEQLVVINGMLSAQSNALFQQKMELLAREFDELNALDRGLPFSQRFGATAVLALRPWDYKLFKHLLR